MLCICLGKAKQVLLRKEGKAGGESGVSGGTRRGRTPDSSTPPSLHLQQRRVWMPPCPLGSASYPPKEQGAG
jgi:hypothetical protein